MAPGKTVEFVDNGIAGLQHRAHSAARRDKRAQIGALGLIDRRRHGDDEEIARPQVRDVSAVGEPFGSGELLLGHLPRSIDAAGELVNPTDVDVEAHDREVPRKIDGEWHPNITKPDYTDADFGEDRRVHLSSC